MHLATSPSRQPPIGLGHKQRGIAIGKVRQTGIGRQTVIEQARGLQRIRHVFADPVRHDIGVVSSEQMMPTERAALERLLEHACGDTHQSRRVADFLLAWWNAAACGAYHLTTG